MVRTNSGGGTHEFVNWLTTRGRWLSYSVGMTIIDAIHAVVLQVPTSAWTLAVEPGGEARDGAWVAGLAGDCLNGWPKGMRLIVRKERPHPGAQLSFTDADGLRLTCFATSPPGPPIAGLEVRHRRRARCEDCIRGAHDTGLPNFPCTASRRTRSGWRSSSSPWTCWPGCRCSPLTGKTRLWEPKRLRLRLFSAAAQLITTGRRHFLHLPTHWPWTDVISAAVDRFQALPNPG
ncbi:transposase [Streptomyces sp. NPDC020800]|uniref:transposase n=1 Tax=Streptomyces sp. NPDC020800 TaxID=3365092 RepID=UPI0037A832BF